MITAKEANNKTRENIIKTAEKVVLPFLTDLERKIAIACDNCEYEILDIFEGYNINEKEIGEVRSILKANNYIIKCRRMINVTTDDWTTHYDLSWETPCKEGQ